MEIVLEEPRFGGRRLSVRAAGVLGRPQLLVDGVVAPESRGRYLIPDADGREVEVRLHRHGDDPVPLVFIDGSRQPELVPPLRWYEEAWLWLPFPLLCWLGLRGAFIGALAVTVNATAFRYARTPLGAYASTGLSTLTAVALGYAAVHATTAGWYAAFMFWHVVVG
jgi:hypothetical protein